MSHIEHQSTGQ